MTQSNPAQNELQRAKIGHHTLNRKAARTILACLQRHEEVRVCAGFNGRSKIMAVTSHRIMVADKDQGMVFNLRYVNITGIHAQGGTLSLHANAGERIREYKMLPETAAKMAQAVLRETGMNPREDEMEVEVALIGDEDLNEKAVYHINRRLRDDETPIAVAGFDFETKVIAITDQRVLVTDQDGTLVFSLNHHDIYLIERDGRTLVIGTRHGNKNRYKFGKDETVQALVETARQQMLVDTTRRLGKDKTAQGLAEIDRRQKQSGNRPSPAASQPGRTASPMGSIPPREEPKRNSETPGIAERVRFWEEQDRINQELIPKVIRQHELLTRHISDHEMLPIVAATAAREAIERAQAETLRQLEEAQTQHQELTKQLEESNAQAERQSSELQEAKGEREKLTGEILKTNKEREEQKEQHLEELSRFKAANRMPKVIATAACVAAAAAIMIAIIL